MDLTEFLGDWSHVLAASLFAALAIWIGRRDGQAQGKLLVAALTLTAIWSLSIAFRGVHLLETGLMESLRNCAWLAYIFTLPQQGYDKPGVVVRPAGLGAIYAVLLAVLTTQSLVDMLGAINIAGSTYAQVVIETGLALRMIWTIGALLLIQRIFQSANTSLRTHMAPVMAAMAMMWTYDLLLYASAYAMIEEMDTLFALRGLAMIALTPMIVLGVRSHADVPIKPSRSLAIRAIGSGAVIMVIMLILLAITSVEAIGSPFLRVIATGAIFAVIVVALVLFPSDHFRSLLKVMIAKHFFAHRYDYRQQWMSFADTIGQAASGDASLYERAIRAVADITDSPAAALLLVEDGQRLSVHSQWNWAGPNPVGQHIDGALFDALKYKFWIVDIDKLRANTGDAETPSLPNWLAQDHAAWALVPIIHFDQITGALLLARPRINRALDWEDFDMLRTAGRQVASYIAEAQGQQALADARRFDEFNRRFAFIMHDIKNLVSQLSLLARNAQRHAENPEFRADMVLTLQDSVGKMNDMLARLSQHNSAAPREPTGFALGDVAREICRNKGRTHPVMTDGNLALAAHADPVRVEQIISHLVQNAIDASAPDGPVLLRVEMIDNTACLSVIDQGCGMSPEFIRNELFRPFASSKQDGFGIGAFEARELAHAMSGTLRVESVVGKGSRFTLSLPLADTNHRIAEGKAA